MKKFSVVLLALSLALSLCACADEKDVSSPDSSVTDSSAVRESSSESSEPSHEGEKLLLYTEKDSFGAFGYAIKTHSYDTYGVLTETSIEAADGTKLTEKYTYDSEGRMISDIKYDEKGDIFEESKWVYDENGLLTEHTDGYLRTNYKYTYDSQNRIATHVENDKDTYVYTYDENGDYFVRINGYDGTVYYKKDGTMYKMTDDYGDLRTDSVFDEKGNKISTTEYGSNKEIRLYTTYEYDENGHMVKQTGHSDGKVSNTFVREYDEFGNLLKIIYVDPLGKEEVRKERTYKYFPVEDKE